ncbi:MAG: BrnT family toxin [Candidatus Marinimicrobia bacterium]|nr:BrnT family toxin [Candidatus Neomarinimicrobiota bacterium]
MKFINWNAEKNELLKKERGISFEIMVFQIENENILDVIEHPNQDKYPGQKIFVIEFEEYAYFVPFVENDDEVFLKTIIPSRKATKDYLK